MKLTIVLILLGGVSSISKRYADASDGESSILYLDANNLYGKFMSNLT